MAEETGIPLKLDTAEFDATLGEYLKVSSRGYATAINTKLYYIALRAIAFTPRADKLKIGKSLSPLIYEFGEAGQRSLRIGRGFAGHAHPFEGDRQLLAHRGTVVDHQHAQPLSAGDRMAVISRR